MEIAASRIYVRDVEANTLKHREMNIIRNQITFSPWIKIGGWNM
jgi:hypothetical protein